MINIETLSGNSVLATVVGKFEEGDFAKIAGPIDELIDKHGSVKLVIDATAFDGWASANAAAKHFNFVRDHQKKIECIALVAGAEWQHWMAGLASLFVHPEIKVFNRDGLVQAESWVLKAKKAA